MKYSWGGKNRCVRYGQDMSGEKHICYYCGNELQIEAGGSKACLKCHFEKCSKCGHCFCSLPQAIQIATRVLRDKYCNRKECFIHGIYKADRWLLEYVPYFEGALNYCRKKVL